MKPIHIGYGNFDESKYAYAYCKCPLPTDWAITFDKILDGKQHVYRCVCEDCGTEVSIFVPPQSPVKVDMTKEEVIRKLESIKETFETFACELDDIHLDIEAIEYAIGYLKGNKEKGGKGMTYGDIYKEFRKKFQDVKVSDYRPAVPMYTPGLSNLTKGIPNAIVIWLEDGSELIYISGGKRKCREGK